MGRVGALILRNIGWEEGWIRREPGSKEVKWGRKRSSIVW